MCARRKGRWFSLHFLHCLSANAGAIGALRNLRTPSVVAPFVCHQTTSSWGTCNPTSVYIHKGHLKFGNITRQTLINSSTFHDCGRTGFFDPQVEHSEAQTQLSCTNWSPQGLMGGFRNKSPVATHGVVARPSSNLVLFIILGSPTANSPAMLRGQKRTKKTLPELANKRYF